MSTTADPQPLAAVTPQDTTEAGDVGTAAWPSVRGLGLLCPSVPVERNHRPPITTQNPNRSPKAKSANPITTGTLQGACCLAQGQRSTLRGTACQRAAYKHNGRCALHGGRSTGPRTQRGLQRISEANLKHGRQTKDKLAAQRHAAEVGSRDMGELKRIEGQIVDAGLMPNDSGRLSRYRP